MARIVSVTLWACVSVLLIAPLAVWSVMTLCIRDAILQIVANRSLHEARRLVQQGEINILLIAFSEDCPEDLAVQAVSVTIRATVTAYARFVANSRRSRSRSATVA